MVSEDVPADGDSTRKVGRSRATLLAGSLLLLELLAGMQAYLLNTVIPLVGRDLDAQQWYGAISGSIQVAMFLTMPLGPWLLARFRVDRLLLVLTVCSAFGAVVSAVAPTIGLFLLGRVISGLSAGALATVSLAAIVVVLPAAWRRGVLAGYSATWVVSSLVGPLYAGWVTTALSWRWALVLYLPLLFAARLVAARQLGGELQDNFAHDERAQVVPSLVLAVGVACLSLVGSSSAVVSVASVVVGLLLVGWGTRKVLPDGALRAVRGRAAALAAMGLLSLTYFGAQAIVGISVYDLLGGSPGEVALVLAGSGLGWAVAGLFVSRWPARSSCAFVRRAIVAVGLICVGCVGLAAASMVVLSGAEILCAGLGWALAGVGMGLIYLEVLNRIVEIPATHDGVSVPQASAAAVLTEAIATAVAVTIASAIVGNAVVAGLGNGVTASVFLVLGVFSLGVVWAARRVGFESAS